MTPLLSVFITLVVLTVQIFAFQTQDAPARGASQQPAPDPPPAGRRGTPPQPRQQQGVDYFVGIWTFAYTGRESPVGTGPRSGTMTVTRKGESNVLDVRTEGQIEGGGGFKEAGTFEWNEVAKTMTIKERLSNGTEITSVGNWSSPLSIRAESQPVQAGKQLIRIRRLYTILSAQSFALAEEISVDGGPFQRLGNGEFSKSAAK